MRRYDRLDAAPPPGIVPDLVAVVAFVSQKCLWLVVRQIDQRFIRSAVRRFAAREVELERPEHGPGQQLNSCYNSYRFQGRR